MKIAMTHALFSLVAASAFLLPAPGGAQEGGERRAEEDIRIERRERNREREGAEGGRAAAGRRLEEQRRDRQREDQEMRERREEQRREQMERREMEERRRGEQRHEQPASPPPHVQLEHLRAAIEQLHAAGLHDLAQELEPRAREIQHHLELRRAPPQPGPEERLNELARQVESLHRAVRELHERIEELQHH